MKLGTQRTAVDKVARIRAELLGAASGMPAAQVVAAALPLMGIVPEPSWALPQMVDAIIVTMTGGGGEGVRGLNRLHPPPFRPGI